MARKRSIDDDPDVLDVRSPAKKAQASKYIDYDMLRSIYNGEAPSPAKKARFAKTMDYDMLRRVYNVQDTSNTASPSSQPSDVTSDLQSNPETAVTSRSSNKRPKKYFCKFDGCSKAFDRPVKLEAHIRTHTDDRPFACEEDGCDKRFFKAEHLKAHVQNKHSDVADFVCTYVLSTTPQGEDMQCGKAFTTATRLKRHVAMHEEKEDLTCHEPECGQIFRKMETLQRHIKKEHLQEDSFRCTNTIHDALTGTSQECGQTFSSASQLARHEVREHVGNKYFCSHCIDPTTNEEMGFATYADYQNHLKVIHPPTCTICSTICASNRALIAHMEIEHSTLASRQKFICEHVDNNGVLCGRGFTKQGNLKVHIQNVHVKSKKFICGQFDLSSNQKVSGWDGQGCGQGFGTKGNLEEHVRMKHLGLPKMYRRDRDNQIKIGSKRGRFERVDDAGVAPGTAMDVDASSAKDTLGLLTGTGYADARPIACWISGCSNRFSREYDLAQHMELKHGWNVDDINDRLAEEAALEGDKFWIGDHELADGNVLDETYDESLRMERLSLSQNGDLGMFVWNDAYEGVRDGNDVPMFVEQQNDHMAIDPMLAGS